MEKILNAIDQKKYCSNEVSAIAIKHIKNNYGKDKMCEATIKYYRKIINY